jgi:NADP-dependent 3-hydroxy acid dehydrogenase YdfG
VLVLPLEHEGVRLCAVDLETSAGDEWTEPASVDLAEEAAADDGEAFIARRAGVRWGRRYERAALPEVDAAAMRLRPQGVYLITGGLGGIGVTLAEWLAARTSARLVLTTRAVLPAREAWDEWLASRGDDATAAQIRGVRRIEAAGGEVIVATADAADVDAMGRAVAAAQARWGEIHGVIHAAGIKVDALMALSSDADADAVLAAKVEGVAVLREIFGNTALDFVVLCSSISAAVGFAGTHAYAAANAYLDAFAVSSQCPAGWGAVSIAWDSWQGVGMATKLSAAQAERAARGAVADGGILPDEGAESFARALASGLRRHLVSPYDVPALLAARRRPVPAGAAAGGAPPERAAAVPARPGSSSFTPPSGAVEERLAGVWEDLLGVTPIGATDNFFELGGHSLLATRVLARIEAYFAVRLPLRTVFEAPTLREIAEAVSSQIAEDTMAVAAAPTGDREEFEL